MKQEGLTSLLVGEKVAKKKGIEFGQPVTYTQS